MEFLQQFINLTIMGLCVVIGYVWTATVPANSPSRRYIPLTMCVLGSVLAAAVLRPVTLEVVLTGAVSGLASTGLHEAFKQLILKPKWIEDKETENKENEGE